MNENEPQAATGLTGPFEEWLQLNLVAAADDVRIAPFPPPALMLNTTGLQRDQDFAAHGVHIARALAEMSPKPLGDFRVFLDFGIGVGQLARIFKGFKGRYVGVDIDADNLAWASAQLPFVEVVKTAAGAALPFAPNLFDGVAVISVFTHLTEPDHLFYLKELSRVAQPGAFVFATVHGERALQRAESEPDILALLQIPDCAIGKIREEFASGAGYSFVLQHGHLTSIAPTPARSGGIGDFLRRLRGNATVPHPHVYHYGITFIDADYIRRHWSRHFEVVAIAPGAIHDFQDLVLLQRRAG